MKYPPKKDCTALTKKKEECSRRTESRVDRENIFGAVPDCKTLYAFFRQKGGELLALGQERDVKAFEANARNCLGEVNLRETVAMRRKICEAVKLLITGKAPVISYGDI